MQNENHICSVEHAKILDSWWRSLLQNPERILKPYIKPGMTVLDTGCGPGFFTVQIAKLVGPAGRVIAADLQPEMLALTKAKFADPQLARRLQLHQCQAHSLDLQEQVDFILAFYMLHETPDPRAFLKELKNLLKPGGQILIVEPRIHVGKKLFEETLALTRQEGLSIKKQTTGLLSRSLLAVNKVSLA